MLRKLFYALALTIALILLGVAAWGAGWVAHKLLLPAEAPPTVQPSVVRPTATPSPTLPPVATPASSATATPALRPTSTLMPSPTFTPTPGVITVQRNEGIYQVCRRYCPGLWPEDGIPESLDRYAHQVAEQNGLRWGRNGPRLREGQSLVMLPCPME